MTVLRTCLLVLLVVSLQRARADEPAAFIAVLSGQPPRLVQLGTIEATGSDLLDRHEGWIQVGPGQCLAVIRRGSWKPRPSRMRVILNDGQVLPGSFITGDQDSIRIDHLWMREMDIPLDRINRIEFRLNVVVPGGEVDRVVLANGDILEGFVNTIADPLIIEIEREEIERIEVPLERVAAVALGGKPEPATWPQVWTVDGLRMSVPRVAVDASGRLALEPHEFMMGEYERLPGTEEIVALVMDGNRFAPLARLPVRTISTSVARRTAPPPRRLDPLAPIGFSDLDLGGPARYEFTLPTGSDRFRARLRRPRSSRRWPSPTVTVSMGGRNLWTGTVQDEVPLDLALQAGSGTSGGPLVIELSCGEQGPVHCGVRLIDPIVSDESR